MKLFTQLLISLSLGMSFPGFCFAASQKRMFIAMPSKKADKASQAVLKKTKNVSVAEILNLVEPFFSSEQYENLLQGAKKARKVKISKITHGKDSFHVHSGSYKIDFKWVNKNKVAFILNSQKVSFKEASQVDLLHKKVSQIVKGSSHRRQKSPQRGAFFFLQNLFGISSAHAADNMTLMWIGVAAVVLGLIAHNMYKKHKEEHENNKAKIEKALRAEEKNLQAAVGRGDNNLNGHKKKITDLKTLLEEYEGSHNNVGFFKYLFFQRMSKPARYDGIMSKYDEVAE